MSKKPIIVFEGIEGSGKTTLIKHVVKYFKKNKISFLSIREPGGNKNSEKIRKLILDKKNKFNAFTDLMLYLASRSENIDKVINKYYHNKIILLDRFTDSTVAYQHYGMNLNRSLIENINKILLKNVKPDLVFLNLINKKNLQKRLKLRKNKNRYDKFKINFYNKVQNGYLKISKKNPKYMIINSNKNLQENKKIVLNNILQKIK